MNRSTKHQPHVPLVEEFPMLLQQLRIDALHNALVETDVAALRIHLILLARHRLWWMELVVLIWRLIPTYRHIGRLGLVLDLDLSALNCVPRETSPSSSQFFIFWSATVVTRKGFPLQPLWVLVTSCSEWLAVVHELVAFREANRSSAARDAKVGLWQLMQTPSYLNHRLIMISDEFSKFNVVEPWSMIRKMIS